MKIVSKIQKKKISKILATHLAPKLSQKLILMLDVHMKFHLNYCYSSRVIARIKNRQTDKLSAKSRSLHIILSS